MTQSFTHNEHRITYDTAGDSSATPIIMIHGWFSHRGTWRGTMDALKDRYYCVAIDLLGFGDSDKPKDGNYCIEEQGKRVLALADELNIDRFILMGHSMGGQTSLCIASMLAPERIIKVVDVSGVVAAKLSPYVERMIYPLVSLGYRLPFLGPLTRLFIKNPFYAKNIQFNVWFHDMNALPYDSWAIDRHMATQPGIEAPAYFAGQAIHHLNLTDHLQHITVPTLAIFGKQDAVVPVSDGHLVNEHVPNSQLVLIDNCGHFPHYEHPQTYLEAMEGFLGE